MSNLLSIEFANARIKSLEKNLLTKDRLTRLMDSSDLTEALRILSEVNYGGGLILEDPFLFDTLLKAEETRTTELVSTLVPDGYGFECFLMKNDYHNAKVYYKGRFTKGINDNALKPNGVIEAVDGILTSNDYKGFPLGMREALEKLDSLQEESMITPRDIDLLLDKAYYKDVFAILKRSKQSVIQRYFSTLADYTNILSMARVRRAGMTAEELEKEFIEEGSLPLKELLEDMNSTASDNLEKYRYGKYSKIFACIVEDPSLILLEKTLDDELIAIFKREKTDMFSTAPIAGYYVGKLIELKVVRLILVCLSNGVDKKQIKRRLRETYA